MIPAWLIQRILDRIEPDEKGEIKMDEYCTCDKPTPTPVLGKKEYFACENCGKEIIQSKDI